MILDSRSNVRVLSKCVWRAKRAANSVDGTATLDQSAQAHCAFSILCLRVKPLLTNARHDYGARRVISKSCTVWSGDGNT